MTLARLPRQKEYMPCSRVTRVKQFTMPARSARLPAAHQSGAFQRCSGTYTIKSKSAGVARVYLILQLPIPEVLLKHSTASS